MKSCAFHLLYTDDIHISSISKGKKGEKEEKRKKITEKTIIDHSWRRYFKGA